MKILIYSEVSRIKFECDSCHLLDWSKHRGDLCVCRLLCCDRRCESVRVRSQSQCWRLPKSVCEKPRRWKRRAMAIAATAAEAVTAERQRVWIFAKSQRQIGGRARTNRHKGIVGACAMFVKGERHSSHSRCRLPKNPSRRRNATRLASGRLHA